MNVSLRTAIIRSLLDDRLGPPCSLREACTVLQCTEAQLRQRVFDIGDRAGRVEGGKVISVWRTWILSELALERHQRVSQVISRFQW